MTQRPPASLSGAGGGRGEDMNATGEAPAFYRFADLEAPVALTGCADVLDAVRRLAPSWPIRPCDPGAATAAEASDPVISVQRLADGGYHIDCRATGESRSYDNLPYIVCALFADLMVAYGKAHPDLLMLHAGAVRIDGRLIAFPARSKTGKSTLTALLARRGATIWSDDVIPVDLSCGHALAFGITPRLRLPLPEALPAEDRHWIQSRIDLGHPKVGFIPCGDFLAPLGERAPITAFIELVRDDKAEPALAPARRADLLKLLILQNFGGPGEAVTLLGECARLVESRPCYRITHPGGDAALPLLFRMLESLP